MTYKPRKGINGAPLASSKLTPGFPGLAAITFISFSIAIVVEMVIFRTYPGVATSLAPIRILCWLAVFGSIAAWTLQSVMRVEQKPLTKTNPQKKPPPKKASAVAESKVVAEAPPADSPETLVRMHVHGGVILPNVVKSSRVSDRVQLTNWLMAPTPSIKIVEGRGGMGKSVLLWMWVHRNVQGCLMNSHPPDPPALSHKATLPSARRPEGIFWWSMEEPVSGTHPFLGALTDWLGVRSSTSGGQASSHEMMTSALNALKSRRFLLVLDGFEAALWDQLDPASQYRADRVSKTQREDDRGCVDPVMGEFLFRFSREVRSSKLILSTRQYPLELDDMDETPVDRLSVEALSSGECLHWFEVDGVGGERARLLVGANYCGFRPIALEAAVALAKHEKSTPCTIESVLENSLVVRSPNLHSVIQASLTAVPRHMRDFFCRLSAFRGILSHSIAEQVAKLTQLDDVQKAIELLVEMRLLEKEADRYYIHPLVRAAAYDRLPDASGFHKSASQILERVGQVKGRSQAEQLSGFIEQMHHLAMGSEYEPARDLYRDKIAPELVDKLGDYPTAAATLLSLFPSGITAPPALEKGSSLAVTVRALGEAFERLGSSSRACALYQLAIDHAHEWKVNNTSDIDYLTLAELYMRMGRLQDAMENLKRSILACQASSEELRLAVAREKMAQLLIIEGDFDEADSQISRATAVVQRWDGPAELADCYSTRAHLMLGQGSLMAAHEAAVNAVTLAEKIESGENVRPIPCIRARLALAQALASQMASEVEPGERHRFMAEGLAQAESAFQLCRRYATYRYMPDIHWVRATFQFICKETEQAVEECAIALRLAVKYESRLLQADIHLLFARICEDQKNIDLGLEHINAARELARCDDKPHCYSAVFEVTQATA